MVGKILGIDPQALLMTMFALVGLYLVLTRPTGLVNILKAGGSGLNDSLIILQGRTSRAGLPSGY